MEPLGQTSFSYPKVWEWETIKEVDDSYTILENLVGSYQNLEALTDSG